MTDGIVNPVVEGYRTLVSSSSQSSSNIPNLSRFFQTHGWPIVHKYIDDIVVYAPEEVIGHLTEILKEELDSSATRWFDDTATVDTPTRIDSEDSGPSVSSSSKVGARKGRKSRKKKTKK